MHRLTTMLVALLICGGIPSLLHAQEAATLDPQLEVFRPYLGKTWRGVLGEPGAKEPMIDISKWERALNGKAVRVLHSLNKGVYGGESLLLWDKEKESLVFYYFTTAGFITTGTMTHENGVFTSHEFVKGNENGITEVRATSRIMPDGTMHTASQYLKNGEWIPGHTAVYKEAPGEEVVFK
ncbi:MAG TPA: hypothetical protein PK916_14190 [Bacteroidota bacterium]|nr:hypothetical protein [Bacteroidota bacterium]